jgi:hypothetical protein
MPRGKSSGDEFGMLDKLRVEAAGDVDAYVALLERELVERLRVNVGLVVENAELKRGRG